MLRYKRLFFIAALAALTILGASGAAFSTVKTSSNGTYYTHPDKYQSSKYKVFYGIDVSYAQGQKIDWVKVKKAGVDFAIIRCGHTWASSGSFDTDSCFARNVEAAYEAGVNVGVYYWSEALTTTEAKNEAAYVNRILKPYKKMITMPVAMDYEFASGFRSTERYNELAKSKGKTYARKIFTNNAIAFMDAVESYGYTPMFYSYRNLVDPNFNPSGYKMDMSRINGKDQYPFWFAQYSTDTSYAGNIAIWQYTSTGKVKGISGNVDRNFWYFNSNAVKTKSGTTSIKNCNITLAHKAYKYTGNKVEPKVTVKYGSKKLTEGTDYQLIYLKNVKKGTANVIVKGIGKYSNVAIKSFLITTNISQATPKLTTLGTREVALDSKAAKLGVTTSTGTLKYTSSNKAVATVNSKGVIVTGGKGGSCVITAKVPASDYNVSASTKVTVKVYYRPKKTKVTKLKKTRANVFRTTWKKSKLATGYQIKYSSSKTFKKARTLRINDPNKLSVSIKSPYKGKYIYVKVRPYRKLNTGRYYGPYSKKVRIRMN